MFEEMYERGDGALYDGIVVSLEHVLLLALFVDMLCDSASP